MKNKIKTIIKDSIATKSCLLGNDMLIKKIQDIAAVLQKALKKGGKILICGNGGSAADSQHFAAELVGRFQKERRGLAALALTTDTSFLTAWGNDYTYDTIFRRQVEALAKKNDIVFAISTSGEAKNVLTAVKYARQNALKTIGLTGKNGGELAKIADLSITIPSKITARIQESHILIIHILCELIEEGLSEIR